MEREYEIYEGADLGAVYAKDSTSFRVWAPTAQQVKLCLYEAGNGGEAFEVAEMQKDVNGTWLYRKDGDLHKVYYTYIIDIDGTAQETNDPYAKAAGVNGVRSMVADLSLTNPKGFENDHGPAIEKETDIIVYELSVADTTADASCGAKYAGKYLGLTERGTKTASGIATGLDHILELGVTHVQIMPCYDFGSIDESRTDIEQYNWGYDPINYNVPEGSYATDPFHGEVRIKELKEMVQTFHNHGIGVIMDVVYNHTYDIENNCFQKCVPDYYYRKDENGYSDASACGNEVASERPMVSKFIIDSLKYWMNEYHMDGFRFDLMGCLDIATLEKAAAELRKDNPCVVLYGEGWAGGTSVLPEEKRCLKENVPNFHGLGAFSDDIRDTVKGHVFYEEEVGYVSGVPDLENDIRYSVVGATRHPEVDYDSYTYSKGPWAKNPTDIVNYVSCHDNLTLWDKLSVSRPDAGKADLLAMNRLSAAMVFTAQGIPFFLSGEEFARTKPIEGTDKVAENSYNLPLYTNSMKYERLEEYKDLYEFYKGLIAFRKAKGLFRLGTTEEVVKHLSFVDGLPANVVAFVLEDDAEKIFVAYNSNEEAVTLELPEKGSWDICIDDDKASAEAIAAATDEVEVKRISCLAAVLHK
uniref:type I pullulanase n=1 Tax=Agathobacter sp. TaxID=2021311 RepID=UPI004056E183